MPTARALLLSLSRPDKAVAQEAGGEAGPQPTEELHEFLVCRSEVFGPRIVHQLGDLLGVEAERVSGSPFDLLQRGGTDRARMPQLIQASPELASKADRP